MAASVQLLDVFVVLFNQTGTSKFQWMIYLCVSASTLMWKITALAVVHKSVFVKVTHKSTDLATAFNLMEKWRSLAQ